MVVLTPSFWQHRAVFVTGGTGFLGRSLVPRISSLGADVTALVRPGSVGFSAEECAAGVTTVAGALSDRSLMRQLFSDYRIDTVFHLAAQSLAGAAHSDPIATLEVNVAGTWNVLEAARQAGVRQTIIASSEKAYGGEGPLPKTELHPLEGRYPYDCSKSCADLIAQMYSTTYGLPVSMVRTPNLFGGGDLNFSRTFPGAIRSTMEGIPFIIRGNGKAVRDFLHVRDAADAWLFLAEKLAEGAPQGAYNFSMGVRWTVLDCVHFVLEAMGRTDLEPVILHRPAAEIAEQYSDCAKAREVLGWRPAFDKRAALAETISWYRARFEREMAKRSAPSQELSANAPYEGASR